MTRKLTGIDGVLKNYVQPQAVNPSQPSDNSQSKRAPSKRRSKTRLGRPPGSSRVVGVPKEKTTLRIDSELMAEYRDWSWEERCQLGELVERALREFKRRRFNR